MFVDTATGDLPPRHGATGWLHGPLWGQGAGGVDKSSNILFLEPEGHLV